MRFVAAAALIAVVAWYLLRDRDGGGATAPAAPASAAARESASPSPTRAPTESPTLAPQADEPTAIVDATHTAMQAIGRRCFAARTPHVPAPGEPDDSVGRLELRLRIQVASGSARVESAEVATERRLRADIRDCIVEASRAASWPVTAPDGTHDIVELFRLGDFIAVPRPDSPPAAPPTR